MSTNQTQVLYASAGSSGREPAVEQAVVPESANLRMTPSQPSKNGPVSVKEHSKDHTSKRLPKPIVPIPLDVFLVSRKLWGSTSGIS